jgi:phosphate ABC transporter phosphate-binding protein
MAPRLLSLAVLALVGCGPTPPADDGPPRELVAAEPAELNARGSTFVEPILRFWANEFADRTGGAVRVNYQGTGSGDGVAKVIDRLVDFGCSDVPLNRKQLAAAGAKGGPVVHVPLVIGAVVPAYNLPGVGRPVTFSGPLLADIFLGKVTTWDDPRVAALNPGLALPPLQIQPVYRADPSGTSFIFADYLAKVGPGFKAAVGVSNDPKWPTGVGVKQPKTDGVAGHVSRTPGAIGYLELSFALGDDTTEYGAVVNRAGTPVRADLASITAAAAEAMAERPTAEPFSLHELTYSLTDAGGAASYPIAGMSYAILYRRSPGAAGRTAVAFLRWATSAEGQAMAGRRDYAPLPDALRARIGAALDQVETTEEHGE